ncbi:MAG TPA: saccharopine dehydrogenase C-terminal domain-containing protein [Pyrinomonadaceae bacterium]|nr:saccharopine dehydrogenase C-terminal domain-containing protein [Pyrinomonadaceae bacterium]
MKILVLGAGRMGLGAAYDLAHNSEGVESVTVADVDEGRARAVAEALRSGRVRAARVNVEDRARVVELMRGHDAAVSCVTYFHNLSLARAALEAGVNFCDLGGNNTVVDAELALDAEAREAGINIIPDCGLAPGMVSVLAAHGAARFSRLDELHIRVGGLPQRPRPPLDYQIVFSVEGLINEYVERARVIRGGHIIEVESMTEVESLDFPEPFGRMEAFQTSGGTSTLPETFAGSVSELDYKTIRYPGHCERFRLLIDLGLCDGNAIDVDGLAVPPRRLLGELLYRHLPAAEPDVVLVRLEFVGRLDGDEDAAVQKSDEHGSTARLRYDIVDRFDERAGLSAMQRTTAFPASVIAQMMARGLTTRKGAVPQERCVPPVAFVRELAARGILIDESFVS